MTKFTVCTTGHIQQAVQKDPYIFKGHIPTDKHILDLGVENPFSKIMREEGYSINNTSGEDLDLDYSAVQNSTYEVVTAFEIFEHLVAPFNVLREIKAEELVASIPLRLWFSQLIKANRFMGPALSRV